MMEMIEENIKLVNRIENLETVFLKKDEYENIDDEFNYNDL